MAMEYKKPERRDVNVWRVNRSADFIQVSRSFNISDNGI